MKYILDEKTNVRFLLSEGRFVLTEANDDKENVSFKKAAAEVANLLLDKYSDKTLDGSVETLAKSNSANKEARINELQKSENDIKNSLANANDIAKIKPAVEEYLGLINKEITLLGNGNGNALNAAELQTLKKEESIVEEGLKSTAAAGSEQAKGVIADIGKAIERIAAAINNAINNTGDGLDEVNEVITKAKEVFKNTLSYVVDKDGNANENEMPGKLENIPVNDSMTNSINTLLTALQKNDTTSLDNVIAAQNACTDWLSDLSKQSAVSPEKDEETANDAMVDWKSLLNDAKSDTGALRKVVDNYYKAEWGNDAEKVKALGRPFFDSLVALGFDASRNPFIVFVKRLINTVKLDKNTYAAINNAYVVNYVNDAMLRDEGDNNLLNCKDLYNYSPSEIIDYLAINSSITNDADEKIKEVYKNIQEIRAAIFDKDIDVKALTPIKTTNLTNITLKTPAFARAAYKTCFNNDAKTVSIAAQRGKEKISATAEKLKDYIRANSNYTLTQLITALITSGAPSMIEVAARERDVAQFIDLRMSVRDSLEIFNKVFKKFEINDNNVIKVAKSTIEAFNSLTNEKEEK